MHTAQFPKHGVKIKCIFYDNNTEEKRYVSNKNFVSNYCNVFLSAIISQQFDAKTIWIHMCRKTSTGTNHMIFIFAII